MTLDWTENFSGAERVSSGNLVVSIDETVARIKNGIAEIDGHQIPTSGPVQVVFLDETKVDQDLSDFPNCHGRFLCLFSLSLP